MAMSAWLVGGFLACFVAGFMLGGAGTSVITSGDSIRSTPAVTLAPLDRSFPLTVRPPPTRDPAVKTVVITTAVSYSFHEWQRFVVPLRRVYDGDVFVLVVESERRVWQDLVAKHRLRTVLLELSEKPPKQGEESSAAGKALELARANAVKKARYAQYNRICAKYDWCFATDFRDVFFQADPFGRLPAGHDLALTQEWAGYPIGKCHVNSEWLLSCWPQAFYDSVKSRPIICSGTILGTPRGFAQLFEAMLAAYAGTAGKRGCFARDQGHLMYVAYSGELERRLPGRVLLQESGRGVAMSLALLNPQAIARFAQRRMVQNSDGEPTPVAHQFDRWHLLNTMFEWQLVLYKQQAAGGTVAFE